jgi:hypothetical protein
MLIIKLKKKICIAKEKVYLRRITENEFREERKCKENIVIETN